MNNENPRVGCIGAGVLGGAIMRRLIDCGFAPVVWNRDMAARLTSQCGMAWLNAPISGGAPAAREGKMAIMVGGQPDIFERVRPLWDALAGRATLMGSNGAGQATKMINQVLVSTGLAVLAEARAFAERAGIDAAKIPQAPAGVTESFRKMVADGLGDRDNTEMVVFYRTRKA